MDSQCTVGDPKKDGSITSATLIVENLSLLELKALSVHLSPSLYSLVHHFGSKHNEELEPVTDDLEPGLYNLWTAIEAAIKELEGAKK